MSTIEFDPSEVIGRPDPHVSMTESALEHFRSQLQASDKNDIRLYIEKSGCSGYMYRISLVESAEQHDLSVEISDDLTLNIDQAALPIVMGTEIDYKKDGLNSLIKFNNPNVVAECGCGESFIVLEG